METTVTSKQFTITLNDFWKGLIIAVITPVFTIVATSIEAGILTFDWKAISGVAGIALLTYLTRNLFRSSAIVMKNPTEAQVDAVKDGSAEVTVTPT